MECKALSAIGGLAAVLSLVASPVAAADFPVAPAPAGAAGLNLAQWDANATDVERHRRWRHRDRVDAGDILAGVLILGGIAAIASAASDDDDRGYDDERYRQPRDAYRPDVSGQGIDRAVDMCLAEIERDARVEAVDNVARDSDGWIVSGRLYDGEGFDCRIGNDGRIFDVAFAGSRGATNRYDAIPGSEDGQWSDDDYAEARRRTERPSYDTDEGVPAYPGGPIDGDPGYEEDYGN